MKIPKYLEKVKEVNWTKEQLVQFELDAKEEWESGSVLGPVHLSKGNEEQLIELSNRVENAVVESFSTASKLANFSEEQKLQIIESMGIEQLDFIRNTQEKSILMQMMTEHATREISEHR